MFDRKQLDLIDPNYFNILTADEYDVAIQSRCTGHCWYIRAVNDACVIFHKHKKSDQYHQNGSGRNLKHALRLIQGHDTWHRGGRK